MPQTPSSQDLLKQLGGFTPPAAGTTTPPSSDELLRQLDINASAATPTPAPPPPKSSQELIKELDDNQGWLHLLTINITKGLTSPVSALLSADLREKMDKTLSKSKENILQRKSTHSFTDSLRTWTQGLGASPGPLGAVARAAVPLITPPNVVDAAGTVAEVGGAAISSLPYSAASRELVGLNKSVNIARSMPITDRAIRQVLSGAGAGGSMSAFAHLEPGESRAALVAKNVAIAGASEVLLAPLFLRSWKEELGVQGSSKLEKTISRSLGVSEPVAQGKITELRAGSSTDVRTAEAVVKAAASDPSIRYTPVVLQAQKRLEATFGRLLPKEPPPMDRGLFMTDPNFGVRLTVEVNGQKFPIQIRSNKDDHAAFLRGVSKLRARVVELSEQGADVKFGDFVTHSPGSWNRFRNAMFGKDRAGNVVIDPKDLPGAATRGTVAESGVLPKEGTKVKIDADGAGASREGEVVLVSETASPAGTVPVKNAVGTVEHVPLDRLRYVVDVQKPRELTRLTPHPEGDERRFIIHTAQQDFSVEAVGASKEQNFFRSEFFNQIDATAELGHDVRGFIHTDGSLTLSVPQVQRFRTLPDYASRVEDMGPQDVLRMKQSTPVSDVQKAMGTAHFGYGRGTTPGFAPDGSRLVKQTVSGKKVLYEYKSGNMSFGAGYVPRKMRDDRFAYPKWMGQRDKTANPLEFTERATAREVPEIELAKVGGPITAQARGKSSKLTQVPTPQYQIPASTKKSPRLLKPKEHWIDKGGLDVPEIITARDSARILLKRGVDPETKVRIRTSELYHAGNPHVEAEWTLRELGQVEPSMVPIDALQAEASKRGYSFIPQGKGGILRDNETGAERLFDYQLEAAESLGRIPHLEVGPKLEDPLERSWKMGWYRSFDADVDSTRFVGTEIQEAGLQDLFGGKRPLINVWATDAQVAGSGEVVGPITETIRAVEKSAGLPPNSLRVQALDLGNVGAGSGKGVPYAIYDPIQVQKIHAQIRPGLEAFGINASTPDQLVAELSKLPNGLDVLKGRDPESALVYSFLRKHKMKEEWELGKVLEDSQGRFRVYDPQMKAALFQRIQGAAKDMEPSDYSLDDFIKWNEDVRFDSHNIEEPGMWEPIDTPDTPAGAPPSRGEAEVPSTIGSWVRPPWEVYKEWEAKTGVPFWTSAKVLQDAKAEVESALAGPYTILNKWKNQYDKTVREQAQIIFETRMQGLPVEDVVRSAHSSASQAADELEQAWRTFLGEMDYGDQEMREFFAEFPQLRRNKGDYKAFVGGRAGLPKLMRTLDSEFRTGEIRVTDREVDGFVLARRIMRMVAQEKHLLQPWNAVKTKIEAYAKTEPGIPKEMFGHFTQHMNSLRHMTDDLGAAINRTADKIFRSLGMKSLTSDQMGDFVSLATGANYAANMAWRPGLILRNLMQTLQTTYPVQGEKWTSKGLAYGLKWLKNEKLQQEMIERGVIPRDALSQSFGDIEDFIINAQSGKGGVVGKGILNFLRKGTAGYKHTDDFNRVVAYQAQYQRSMEYGQQYLDGKIDWRTFVRKSKLDLQDAKGGPVEQWVSRLLNEKKDVAAAAHALADNFQRFSQFQYSRENAARIFQSTAGRIFGQYGTWSTSYVEYMRSLALRGSWENRAKALSRWAGMNAAIYYGASEVFGVAAAQWTFFSPMAYTGGPAVQLAQQVGAAATLATRGEIDVNKTLDSFWEGDPSIKGTKSANVATKMAAGKLVQGYRQFVPGFGAGKDVYNMFQEEEFGEAVKRMLNMPSTKTSTVPSGVTLK